ncbi:MAG: aldehyde dehydrogenase family protein, partial [Alphaproteobacteria bacterium]|nr:aldehyde dehydrogenase family protein [Alphaproteobacteria bacterium]
NAMIVDSTALPEHAVRDIVNGAFRSAGQRCSALRCLYVQDDIADKLLTMLKGAMNTLTLGDPWDLSTDIGPVIDADARSGINAHITQAAGEGRVLHQLAVPGMGEFVAPTIIALDSIAQLEREIFGPVLHVVRFKSRDLNKVIDAINATGYGLTFGLHTRIDDRVETMVNRIDCGNIYVNRDQIGAIVGSQPFGGEGLSGTGPKAGGPQYLPRFTAPRPAIATPSEWDSQDRPARLTQALTDAPVPPAMQPRDMPGPTGESNRLTLHPRGPVLCLGPGPAAVAAQAKQVEQWGGQPVMAQGTVAPGVLTTLAPLAAVIWWGNADQGRTYARALADRDGPIIALVTATLDIAHVMHERHVCIDTTAAGGNAALLAEVGVLTP